MSLSEFVIGRVKPKAGADYDYELDGDVAMREWRGHLHL